MFVSADKILAVDTSSRILSVAIRAGEGTIFEANLEGTPRHSEALIDLVEQGLKRVDLKKGDLDAFLWGLGPGSFTGLRIGLSFLKGFHVGLRKKAFGASSLDLIALGSGMTKGKLAVCVDAKREQIYTAIYQFQNGSIGRVLEDSLLSFGQLIESVDRETIFTGDALHPYGKQIREKLGEDTLFLDPSFWYPHALFLIRLYEAKRDWLEPLSLSKMAPRYLRLSEAEERITAKRK